ncbi:MAG: hypothetical protein AAFY71_27190 [Bacteroidota bacterium]
MKKIILVSALLSLSAFLFLAFVSASHQTSLPNQASNAQKVVHVTNSPAESFRKDFRFSVPGVIDHLPKGKDACRMQIKTKTGVLEVLDMPEHDYEFEVGQKILISYETQNLPAHCGARETVILYDFDLQ